MNNEKEIQFIVVKNFIRIIKNHDLYNFFKKNVLKSYNNEISNPFGKFKNFNELANNLISFTNNEFSMHFHSNLDNDYERITLMINHLLHFFLENYGINIKDLSLYGKEIYDLSCYEIFGDIHIQNLSLIEEEMNSFSSKLKREIFKMQNKNNL